ncbi:type II toxin-antitoxin system TacA family antitoxin [Rhizobium sp.]
MPRAAVESTRYAMRLDAQDKSRLMRAAIYEKTDLKNFILRSALEAADRAIERHETIRLSERDYQRLLDLLDNPPPINERLLAAAKALPKDR